MTVALTHGANFWNGGEIYGTPTYNSLHLLSAYFTAHPSHAAQVVLSIKGGCLPGTLQPAGTRANIRRSVDECVRLLSGRKKIDIFESARVDPAVPIEETVGYLAELVAEGKIGGIGLSEVSAATIRRAAKVHVIAAVEVEVSLWTADVLTNGVGRACAELGIPIVAYSPLSRGALTGEIIRRNADLPEGDLRRMLPRFQDDVLERNNKLVEEVEALAARKGVSKTQVALAWVRQLSGRKVKDEDGEEWTVGTVIPIPGATTPERVKENCTVVELTEQEMVELGEILERNPVQGDRYHSHGMALVNG
jgi:pyridoxine 4-dehydrogenase